MLKIIKEIGIFILIAQAILYFIPGNSYVKYVKILVGIMMIALMAKPVLSLVSGGEWKEIGLQTKELEKLLEAEQADLEIEDNSMGIYSSIEEELKSRLNHGEVTDYYVEKVELQNAGEDQPEGKEGFEYITVNVRALPAEGGKELSDEGKIRVEKITVDGQDKETAADPSGNQDRIRQLKEDYGSMIGIAEERIEIQIIR